MFTEFFNLKFLYIEVTISVVCFEGLQINFVRHMMEYIFPMKDGQALGRRTLVFEAKAFV